MVTRRIELSSMILGLLAAVQIAVAAEPAPPMLQNVGIEPKLGATLPLDLEFVNEAGVSIRLQNYFDGRRPVILALVYFECPNLCNYLMEGAGEGLNKLVWQAGKEFQVVAVSIDPKESPSIADKKREKYPQWNFLVGKEENIQTLAGAVGFRYQYDPEIKQYAHAAGLFVFTPSGRLTRTLMGIQFAPRDLRLALTEASEGKIGNVVDKLLLLCYAYDPKANKYTLFAGNLMKAGGAVTLFALGFLVFKLGRKRA